MIVATRPGGPAATALGGDAVSWAPVTVRSQDRMVRPYVGGRRLFAGEISPVRTVTVLKRSGGTCGAAIDDLSRSDSTPVARKRRLGSGGTLAGSISFLPLGPEAHTGRMWQGTGIEPVQALRIV